MHRSCSSDALKIVIGVTVLVTGDMLAEEPISTDAHKREQNAHAQMVQPFFEELDCENLGYVQPGEVEEHIGPIFISFDANGSQDIDQVEWRTYPSMRDKPLMELSFSVADRDRNNKINFREFTDYLTLAVSALDSDGDGEVSPGELEALLPAS